MHHARGDRAGHGRHFIRARAGVGRGHRLGGIGSGSAKLILFGEHAAVHGHAAVGVSLAEVTTVSLVDRSPGEGWDFESVPKDDRGSIAAMVRRVRELMPQIDTLGACRVTVDSRVPRAAGFGSSSALCAALVRAARAHAASGRRAEAPGSGRAEAPVSGRTESGADPTADWRLANELEKLFHGTPSGVDTGLSLMEGTWAFQPGPRELPALERLPGPLPALVVAAVPRDESTGALVAGVSRRVRAGDEEAARAIRELGGIAGAARDALRRRGGGDAAGVLAALADQAMVLLRGLGLSVPALDALLEAGKRAGAMGGKLSGAGGGGAFFLVARDAGEARAVARRLEEEAARLGIRMVSPARVLS